MIDPVTLAVVHGSLEQTCGEMDAALIAAAISPVIAEGHDRGSGIYQPDTGELIVQGSDGVPLFVAVMQTAVKSLLASVESYGEGDVFIANDPYEGGTHLMDVRMVRPVFYRGDLVAFIGNMGHWADIGGAVPGGYSTSAREIYAEGLQIPAVRLVRAGVVDEDLLRMILRNVRRSAERIGDIEAQLGALEIGAHRIHEIIERWGVEVLHEVANELRRRSEAQARTYIEQIPDGIYEGEDHLDSDGVVFEPLLIHLRLQVARATMTFDFSGSSKACAGSMNAPLAVTTSSCLIAIKHLFPEAMLNAGFISSFDFVVPDDSFLNARSPRPVAGCSAEVSQHVVDTVFGALARAMPDRVPAAAYSTACNMAVAGEDEEFGQYVSYLYTGGGYGGSREGDGLTNGPATISVAAQPGIEVYEQRAPILFTRFEIRPDSCGAGRSSGGLGVVREFRLRRGRAQVSVMGERGRYPAFGVNGGRAGATTEIEFRIGNTKYVPPHLTKVERVEIEEGDLVRVSTPGGGGWGDPSERTPEKIRNDLERGYVSGRYAQANYPSHAAKGTPESKQPPAI